VALSVTSPEQQMLVSQARRMLAVHERARDLIEVGAYAPGSDPELDQAVLLAPALEAFRRQDLQEACQPEQSWAQLAAILGFGDDGLGQQMASPQANMAGQPDPSVAPDMGGAVPGQVDLGTSAPDGSVDLGAAGGLGSLGAQIVGNNGPSAQMAGSAPGANQ
jgi:hypothetical protein